MRGSMRCKPTSKASLASHRRHITVNIQQRSTRHITVNFHCGLCAVAAAGDACEGGGHSSESLHELKLAHTRHAHPLKLERMAIHYVYIMWITNANFTLHTASHCYRGFEALGLAQACRYRLLFGGISYIFLIRARVALNILTRQQ
jgi:hypothetical protein